MRKYYKDPPEGSSENSLEGPRTSSRGWKHNMHELLLRGLQRPEVIDRRGDLSEDNIHKKHGEKEI